MARPRMQQSASFSAALQGAMLCKARESGQGHTPCDRLLRARARLGLDRLARLLCNLPCKVPRIALPWVSVMRSCRGPLSAGCSGLAGPPQLGGKVLTGACGSTGPCCRGQGCVHRWNMHSRHVPPSASRQACLADRVGCACCRVPAPRCPQGPGSAIAAGLPNPGVRSLVCQESPA